MHIEVMHGGVRDMFTHIGQTYWIAGVQGWHSGESTRLPPMWPGFDFQTWRHMWVEFVGSLLCTERFSLGTPVSPLLLLISVYSVPN